MSITVHISDQALARMLYLEAKRHGFEQGDVQLVFLDPLTAKMPEQAEGSLIIGITDRPDAVSKSIGQRLFALLELPFSSKELESVVLRFRSKSDLRVERTGDLLFLNGIQISLSHTEARLFDLLYDNRHRPVTEAEMIALLGESATKTNTVAVYLHRLRRKLGDADNRIKTVRGIGAQWIERGQTV